MNDYVNEGKIPYILNSHFLSSLFTPEQLLAHHFVESFTNVITCKDLLIEVTDSHLNGLYTVIESTITSLSLPPVFMVAVAANVVFPEAFILYPYDLLNV